MNTVMINTIEDAIRFLESIQIEVIGLAHGWIVHGVGAMNDDLELNCDTNADLIDWARYERDISVRLCAELGFSSITGLVAFWNSCSPTVDVRQRHLADWMSPPGSNKAKEVTR